MIDAMIEKISGLFQVDFLFGAVLPLLLFLLAAGATFAAVIGPTAGWELIKGSPLLKEKTLAASLFGLVLISSSYFLNALRPALLRFWAGSSGLFFLTPFHDLGRTLQRRTFETLRERALADSTLWSKRLSGLREKLVGVWGTGTASATPDEIQALARRIDGLYQEMQEPGVQNVLDEIVASYKISTVASLGDVYRKAQSKLNELAASDKQRQRLALADLDRRFGKLESLAPTELGNVIQAYNDYPFERYCMEGEIFWPRLQKVMEAEFRALVQDQQTRLDFSLASASLSLFSAILWLVLGPWIWGDLLVWLGLVVASGIVAYLFYRLGCISAWKLGDLFRASFDLFRLDLLKALGGVAPQSIKEERATWRQFSTLLVYGGEFAELDQDFKILGTR